MRNPLESIKFLSELRMRAWDSAEYHARNNNDSASEHARRQFDALGDAINVLTATPSAQAGEVVAYFKEKIAALRAELVQGGGTMMAPEWHVKEKPAWQARTERRIAAYEAAASALATQPQGDASPRVSGGGEVLRALMALRYEAVMTKERAVLVSVDSFDQIIAALSTPRTDEPAPTVDGGEGATHRCEICDYEGTPDPVVGCPRCKWDVMQPITTPDVARLVKALTLAANRMDRLALECPHGSAIRHDAHEWVGQARTVIAEQQEATSGQD